MKFKNKYHVEHAVCLAFTKLGMLAGVNVGYGTGPDDLDQDLIMACYESNFGDPHFLGGPTCIIRIESMEKIDKVFTKAFGVADRLAHYISAHGSVNKVKLAKQNHAVIVAAHRWLIQSVNATDKN
ncbi:hypothetical protein AAKU58_004113 [Oxalobacteraceae bacterium GrIS 1.18]